MDWLIYEVFSQAVWIGETLAAADPVNVGIVFRDETRKPRARMQAGLQRAEREFASLPPDAAAEIRKLQSIVNGAAGAISFLDGAKYYAGQDLAGCGKRGWSAVIRHIKGVPFLNARKEFPVNPAVQPPQTAMPETSEGNSAGAALVESQAGKPAKRKQGRPADTNEKEDKRIFEAWRTRRYKKQADCDRELGLPAGATYAAVERHRKRLARRNKRRRTK